MEKKNVMLLASAGQIGVTISSQSGFRMPALTAKEDEHLHLSPVSAQW